MQFWFQLLLNLLNTCVPCLLGGVHGKKKLFDYAVGMLSLIKANP